MSSSSSSSSPPSPSPSSSFTVEPIPDCTAGAVVHGVDLANGLKEEEWARINSASKTKVKQYSRENTGMKAYVSAVSSYRQCARSTGSKVFSDEMIGSMIAL